MTIMLIARPCVDACTINFFTTIFSCSLDISCSYFSYLLCTMFLTE